MKLASGNPGAVHSFARFEALGSEKETIIFVRVERRVEINEVDKVLVQLVSNHVEVVAAVEATERFVRDSGIQYLGSQLQDRIPTQTRAGQEHSVLVPQIISFWVIALHDEPNQGSPWPI